MSSTEFDVMQRAEEIRHKRLEALGLAEQYDLWRESLPNARSISNAEAYSLFLEAQNIEQAALDGRVSVATGGTDEGPATPTPIPGPDAEDTGTDAPGDTSEGAPEDGEPGDLSLSDLILKGEGVPTRPEGMWEPPAESEALNYEPPSTSEMVGSDEWMEAAKAHYKFMGSPDLVMGGPSPGLAEERRKFLSEMPPTTDEDIRQWAKRELSSFNWNVASTLGYAHKIMTSEDPKAALNFLNLINMYDHSDGGAGEFGMAILNLASDPTTYSGLGVGSVAARGAAKQLVKSQLKKSIQLAIIGGTAGTIEGASLAGGFDLTVQNIEQEAGAREDIDYGRAGKATAMGAGLGLLLGGGGGHLVGRRMDKIAKENEKMLSDLLGGRLVEAERAAENQATNQIKAALENQIAKEAEKGRRATDAEMILRFIEGGHEVPRKADGSIDQKVLADKIKMFHDRETGAIPKAKISEKKGEVDIEYDVLANDEVTDNVYRFFDEMKEQFGDEIDLQIQFSEKGARITAKPKPGYEGDVSPSEMIHEEWETREIGLEEFQYKGQGEITTEEAPAEINRIVDELTVQRDDPAGWFYDETIDGGELSYFEPDSDYANLEAIAERLGIKTDVGGRGGVEAFFVKGDNIDKAMFMQEIARQAGKETILPGRRGGKPFTVEEGLARGLDDEHIAALELDPVNVVDKLERAGFKVALGEKGEPFSGEVGDLVFDAADMSPATAERIERVATQTGVKAKPYGAFESPKSQLQDISDAADKSDAGWFYESDREVMSFYDPFYEESDYKVLQDLADEMKLDWDVGGRGGADAFVIEGTPEQKLEFIRRSGLGQPPAETKGYIAISGDPVDIARFGAKMVEEVQPARLPMAESKELARRIAEIETTAKAEVIGKSASQPGSHVRDATGAEFEVVGRTKNGWYHLRNRLTGEEVNRRRNQFEVIESQPKPERAGPMELAPFTTNAARIISMNEDVVSGKLEKVKITTGEQKTIVKELREMGIKIDQKKLATHWTPAELLYLRDTYNSMANGMMELGRALARDLKNNGHLTDQQLALFNEAHTTFVATRDLFFGVSGNAARQLQILKTRPTDEVYEFSQGLMDAISISGGRTNTERAITMFADLSEKDILKPGQTRVGAATKISDNIWGSQIASAFLIVRYNMMLSSWRTHFFNFLGNSASGTYQHLMVNPIKMGINNTVHASQIAMGVLDPRFTPDPADRITFHQQWAGLRSHFSSARDSLALAKEIALGRDIGEGKVWNELGLRYNVINVPDSAFAKLGTTPVRMLEAGDAFFKNQYYMSKIHELSSMKARADEVHRGMDFQTQYRKYVDDPEAPMMRQAKEYAAKQTYTNDPNVYGGVLAAVARGAATAQQRNIAVNMILPFVRTPANLLSYSMEMIGANVLLSPNTTYKAIMRGSAQESQEAIARLTSAAGLWMIVYEMYQNGNITGTGPSNWEERKAWEAGGWQANSIKVHGKWYDIARADPAGQSLVSIASVFDYYAMTQQQNKPMTEWIGAGLLYTADMIVDESYLSTVSDVITAIQSKEEARARSVTASLINSFVVPNLLRDIRTVTDPEVRSAASDNLMDQVVKQMKNASPWNSDEIPSGRDWKGDTVDRYGNAYQRGLIPFKIRDPMDSDPASMAISYARIPPSTPNRTIEWPKGNGDAINLFAMDGGSGFVYDKYLEVVGKARNRAVKTAMATQAWKRMVRLNNNGPGSDGEDVLRRALAIGSHIGRLQMLDWLIDHSGENAQFRRANGDLILVEHPISVREYIRLRREIRRTDVPLDVEEFPQYQIEHRQEGPEFFKPRTPE